MTKSWLVKERVFRTALFHRLSTGYSFLKAFMAFYTAGDAYSANHVMETISEVVKVMGDVMGMGIRVELLDQSHSKDSRGTRM